MTTRLNKFILTSHITFSVGWIGAVGVFLALAITGLNSPNMNLVRSSYLAMELSAWYVIVPLCLTSLITGIVYSLGTKWGLFKHYWVAVKLFLTIFATLLLLLHLQPINYLAGLATDASFSMTQEAGLRLKLVIDAGAAILLLLTIITISVYKPWGKIQWKFGNSNQQIEGKDNEMKNNKSLNLYILLAIIALILFIIIKHLSGGIHGH